MAKYFHLTIGPVQGFVAQARRSKDLWSGSFLLSWLSAVAIATVKNQNTDNQILFPEPDENFIKAVIGEDVGGNWPKQGGIPNRFKGLTAQVNADFPANEVVKYVQFAWGELAETVWQEDILSFCNENDIDPAQMREIWDRQVSSIWEISWVLTDNEFASNLLDRRKNWRNHYPSPEPGSKCMMMEGWQELSGIKESGARTAFWKKLRNHINKTDLEEGEQLCALAFIKRRFARIFEHFGTTGESFDASNEFQPIGLTGWSFKKQDKEADYDPNHVPSLPLLAAMPFIERAYHAIQDKPELGESYTRLLEKMKPFGRPSSHVSFKSLDSSLSKIDLPHYANDIDGQCFYPDGLRNQDSNKAKQLEGSINDFCKKAGIAKPSPFYAILLMDGDSLGSQMSDQTKQSSISHALNDFTRGVQPIVEDHNGFLIYAGGDDVLAFMPIHTVLDCAFALEQFYAQCFGLDANDKAPKGKAFSTLSGAIQIAHIRTPLMKIVGEAHGLLDDVAKDQSGRHSLAIRINKPGGVHAQWVMPYRKLKPKTDQEDMLSHCVSSFIKYAEHQTHGLLFKLIDVIENIGYAKDSGLLTSIAKAEFVHSGKQLQLNESEVKEVLPQLENIIALTKQIKRELCPDTYDVNFDELNELNSDGIRVLRFFATQGQDNKGSL